MVEGWINDVVLAFAGVIVGSLGVLLLLNDPASDLDESRLPHEGYLHWVMRVNRAEEDARMDARKHARTHRPLPFTLVGGGLYAFLGVLVLLIVVTPLEMRWWFFLGGLFAAVTALGKISGVFGNMESRARRTRRGRPVAEGGTNQQKPPRT